MICKRTCARESTRAMTTAKLMDDRRTVSVCILVPVMIACLFWMPLWKTSGEVETARSRPFGGKDFDEIARPYERSMCAPPPPEVEPVAAEPPTTPHGVANPLVLAYVSVYVFVSAMGAYPKQILIPMLDKIATGTMYFLVVLLALCEAFRRMLKAIKENCD